MIVPLLLLHYGMALRVVYLKLDRFICLSVVNVPMPAYVNGSYFEFLHLLSTPQHAI